MHCKGGEGWRHKETAGAEERVVAGDVGVKVDNDSQREGEHTVIRSEPGAGEVDRADQGQGTGYDRDKRDVRGHQAKVHGGFINFATAHWEGGVGSDIAIWSVLTEISGCSRPVVLEWADWAPVASGDVCHLTSEKARAAGEVGAEVEVDGAAL